MLVVMIEDDGRAREGPLVRVADRVGALDGTAELRDGLIRVELPCG